MRLIPGYGLTFAILLASSPVLTAAEETFFRTAVTPAGAPLFQTANSLAQLTMIELLDSGREATLVINNELQVEAVFQTINVLHDNGHVGFGRLTLQLSEDLFEANRHRSLLVNIIKKPAAARAASPKRRVSALESKTITINQRAPYREWVNNQTEIIATQAEAMIVLYTEGCAETKKLKYEGEGISEIKKRTAENGIRIYYVQYDTVLIILHAGNKSSEREQIQDIKKATVALQTYFEEVLDQIFEPKAVISILYYERILKEYKIRFPEMKNEAKAYDAELKKFIKTDIKAEKNSAGAKKKRTK